MDENKKQEGTEGIEESKLPVISSAKDIFEEIDPEELIRALEKRVTGAWAYEFMMDGKPVHGLSSVGADETALFIAQKSKGQTVIRIMPGSFKSTEEPDCFKVEVMAGVYVVGFYNGKPTDLLLNSAFGFSKMPKKGTRKDKSTWDIPHAEAIALTKAQRNAKAHLIPDKIKEVIMRVALQKGKMSKTDPDGSEEETVSGNEKEKKSEKKSSGKKDWNLFWMTAKKQGWSQEQAHKQAQEKFGIGDSLTELTVEQFDELIEHIRQNPKDKK